MPPEEAALAAAGSSAAEGADAGADGQTTVEQTRNALLYLSVSKSTPVESLDMEM